MMKNWKKKLVSCLLTFVLTAVLLPTFLATPAEAAMSGYTAWTSTNSLPTSGSYYLANNVTTSDRYSLSGDLNLDLNGKTVTFTGDNQSSAINVKGHRFDLYDSVGSGKITQSGGKVGRAVLLNSSSDTFYMHSGTISGFNWLNNNGGGVAVQYGAMYMYGGTITDCMAVGGGGVAVGWQGSAATFVMNGGTISGCRATDYGGGVYLTNSTFTMNGGTIADCIADDYGGGVNVNGSYFYMNGGTISSNTASINGGGVHVCRTDSSWKKSLFGMYDIDCYISSNKAVSGAGVEVDYGTVDFSLGQIYSNTASHDAGGIFCNGSSATVNMYGGDIYNNTAGLSGGGIGCYSGTVNVSGGTIDYNTAKDDGGGGIGGWDKATIKISGTAHIYGNSATNTTSGKGQGGAIMGRRSTAITFNGGRIGSGNTAYGISTVYSDNAVTYNSGRFYTGSSYTSNPTSKYSTITFNQNSGNNGTSSISYQYWNSNLPNITVPSRTGYTFNGYKNSNGELYYNANGTPYNKSGDGIKWDYIGAQTLTAQWTPITYTIAYDTNGGEGTINSTAATYDANATLAAAPTRTGYTFNGWNTVADGTGTTYQAGESVSNLTSTNGATVTLYAQWTPNTYTVTLNKNGGECADLTSYTYGEGATLPTPTRDKYVFSGWFEDEKFTGNKVTAIGADVTGDMLFYAKWTAIIEEAIIETKPTVTSKGTYYESYYIDENNEKVGIGTPIEVDITDWHLMNNSVEKGGLMGHQEKIDESGVGRTIIGLTQEQLNSIGNKLVIVGGDYDKETTVTIDCAYTYFYDDNKMITAKEMGVAAFVIIEDNGKGESISGYGYYRLYSDSEDNFLFDVMYKGPSKN